MALFFTVDGPPSGGTTVRGMRSIRVVWARFLGLVSGMVLIAVFLGLPPGGTNDAIDCGGGGALRRLMFNDLLFRCCNIADQMRGLPVPGQIVRPQNVPQQIAPPQIGQIVPPHIAPVPQPMVPARKVVPVMTARNPKRYEWKFNKKAIDHQRRVVRNGQLMQEIFSFLPPEVLRHTAPFFVPLHLQHMLAPGPRPELYHAIDKGIAITDDVMAVRRAMFGTQSKPGEDRRYYDNFVKFWKWWHTNFGGSFLRRVLAELEMRIFDSVKIENLDGEDPDRRSWESADRIDRLRMIVGPQARTEAFWDRIDKIITSMDIVVDFSDKTIAEDNDLKHWWSRGNFWKFEVLQGLWWENHITDAPICAAAGRYTCFYGQTPVFSFYLYHHLYVRHDRWTEHDGIAERVLEPVGASSDQYNFKVSCGGNDWKSLTLILHSAFERLDVLQCSLKEMFVTNMNLAVPENVLIDPTPLKDLSPLPRHGWTFDRGSRNHVERPWPAFMRGLAVPGSDGQLEPNPGWTTHGLRQRAPDSGELTVLHPHYVPVPRNRREQDPDGY